MALFALQKSNAQCGYRFQNDLLFDVQVTKDIQYGQALNTKNKVQNLRLDFYNPTPDTMALRPLLIFLHGGSFLDGNKNLAETTMPCMNLAKRGFAVAGVDYRLEDNYFSLLFSELLFKATIRATQDARAAIRFFYKQAKEDGNPYRIDTNQIFLGGVSAGAITALHTAYLDDISEADFIMSKFIRDLNGLEGSSGNEGYSTKVKGVVNISGCMLDRTYVNNNRDIPLLNVQYVNDVLFPSYYGRPLGLLTMPVMMGSFVIARQMDKMGIYNMNYMIKDRGVVPYIKDGKASELYFDSVMNYTAKFMFSLIECNPARVNISNVLPQQIKELSIFPNPSRGYIVLGDQNFDINLVKSIRIIDLSGREVFRQKVRYLSYLIDLSSLPFQNNIYIVEALGEKNQIIAQQKLFFSK
ncbi:MAG TPA: alpha/beta hydrolase fold domain-containing protein [Chitinophagales bacterium]|nr:alpha/beta hydrolase fold domain-containing protein [Chitinophagales bacterium]